jgi:hypothetical protein
MDRSPAAFVRNMETKRPATLVPGLPENVRLPVTLKDNDPGRAAGVERHRVAITRALKADSSSWCAMRSPLRLSYPCEPCSDCLPNWTHPSVQSRVIAGSSRASRIACPSCPIVRSARPLPSGAVLATQATDTHRGFLPRLQSLSMPRASEAAAPASRVVKARPNGWSVEVSW